MAEENLSGTKEGKTLFQVPLNLMWTSLLFSQFVIYFTLLMVSFNEIAIFVILALLRFKGCVLFGPFSSPSSSSSSSFLETSLPLSILGTNLRLWRLGSLLNSELENFADFA